jgi:hypothetical protein
MKYVYNLTVTVNPNRFRLYKGGASVAFDGQPSSERVVEVLRERRRLVVEIQKKVGFKNEFQAEEDEFYAELERIVMEHGVPRVSDDLSEIRPATIHPSDGSRMTMTRVEVWESE